MAATGTVAASFNCMVPAEGARAWILFDNDSADRVAGSYATAARYQPERWPEVSRVFSESALLDTALDDFPLIRQHSGRWNFFPGVMRRPCGRAPLKTTRNR